MHKRVYYLRVSGSDDFGGGELVGEANHEAAQGFVAVEASVVSADDSLLSGGAR